MSFVTYSHLTWNCLFHRFEMNRYWAMVLSWYLHHGMDQYRMEKSWNSQHSWNMRVYLPQHNLGPTLLLARATSAGAPECICLSEPFLEVGRVQRQALLETRKSSRESRSKLARHLLKVLPTWDHGEQN